MRRLRLQRSADGSFSCALPQDVRNSWCVMVLRPAGQRSDMPARVRLRMDGDPTSSFETYVPAPAGVIGLFGRATVVHIPGAAMSLHVDLFGVAPSVQDSELWLFTVSRTVAGGLLAWRRPALLRAALKGGRRGLVRRLRTALALLAGTPAGHRSYPLWIELFDGWASESPQLHDRAVSAKVCVVVFQPGSPEHALDATLASLPRATPIVIRGTGATARASLARQLGLHDAPYVALVQAGEILRPGALDVVRETIAGGPDPDAIFADEDGLDGFGRRQDPIFKPAASHSLMLSGTLTRGIWVFRRSHLLAQLAEQEPAAKVWAETLRLDAWLRLYELPQPPLTARLPYVLTHRHPDTQAAPAEVLAETVRRHIARTELPARMEREAWPLQVRFELPQSAQPLVSIIVPTAGRSPHVTECLSAVLAQTDYSSFEMVIVLSQTSEPDDVQAKVLEPVLRDKRVRLVRLDTTSFNFSQANNFGVRHAHGALICLLNDDVTPMQTNWLAGMAGHLADPRIGAVGAKLYYPNRTIQHAGVLIGVAGLAAHANRMLAQDDPGYASRAILNQEVSAVTGACLLVRRSLYDALGGLDETYPIAFNDIDFCLRIREAGQGIVFSAQTEMWHYESVSLGHHFSGARAEQEASELLRMRMRWAAICVNDPFHNPNLSQERGAEWELAFPPRVQPPGAA